MLTRAATGANLSVFDLTPPGVRTRIPLTYDSQILYTDNLKASRVYSENCDNHSIFFL